MDLVNGKTTDDWASASKEMMSQIFVSGGALASEAYTTKIKAFAIEMVVILTNTQHYIGLPLCTKTDRYVQCHD
jgi:hypothetical protein